MLFTYYSLYTVYGIWEDAGTRVPEPGWGEEPRVFPVLRIASLLWELETNAQPLRNKYIYRERKFKFFFFSTRNGSINTASASVRVVITSVSQLTHYFMNVNLSDVLLAAETLFDDEIPDNTVRLSSSASWMRCALRRLWGIQTFQYLCPVSCVLGADPIYCSIEKSRFSVDPV